MTPEDARYLLDAIQESRYKANKWEIDFLLSVGELVDFGQDISEKQSYKLQEIYRLSQGG